MGSIALGGDDVGPTADGWRADARRVATSAAAGGLIGAVGVGIASRLLMAVIRLTSSDTVRGVTSDDGFVIGRFSRDTLNLMLVTGALGAAVGVGYMLLRVCAPALWVRRVAWPVTSGVTAAAAIVHTDGVDFTLLGPVALTVGGFTLLPVAAALAIGVLADRWWDTTPRRDATTAVQVVGLATALPSAPVSLPLGVLTLVVARAGRSPVVGRVLHALALTVLGALLALGTADLVRDVARLT